MKVKQLAPVATLGLILLVSCSSHDKKKDKGSTPSPDLSKMSLSEITHENVQELISNWPDSSKNAANTMIQKYGLPQGVTSNMLVWNESGPFKRSIVYKEEVTHLFPQEHKDVLEQYLDYKVPAQKMDELGLFDGSIKVDRTKGEISAHCNSEEMNILALNLANEVINGEMTVENARKEYGESANAYSMGRVSKYTSGLSFTPGTNTADPGKSLTPTIQAEEEPVSQ